MATRTVKARKVIPKEVVEQQRFHAWLRSKNILHFATTNGGYKDHNVARGQFYIGVTPGVPDYCIPIPSGKYHGLWIEMKRQNGSPSDLSKEQKAWLEALNENGYLAVWSKGFEHAKKVVENYLRLED